MSAAVLIIVFTIHNGIHSQQVPMPSMGACVRDADKLNPIQTFRAYCINRN